MTRKQLHDLLTKLNNHYGKGDVVSVNVTTGEFHIKPFQCKLEKRKFRIEGHTVFALGHQRSIDSPYWR